MRFLFLLVLCLAGCKGEAIETATRGDFKVEKLFVHEGVTMYRFSDMGRYIYYGVTASGGISIQKDSRNEAP